MVCSMRRRGRTTSGGRGSARPILGRPLRAVPRLDEAAVIVSVDADLFGPTEPLSVKYNRDFATGRMLRDSTKAGEAAMNRLYVLESGFTITGSMADHRRAVKPSAIPAVVAAIAANIGLAQQADVLTDRAVTDFVTKLGQDVQEAMAAGKKAVFVAGSRQPAEVHAAVAAINGKLGAPVDYYAEPEDARAEQGWTGHAEQLKAFVTAAAGAKEGGDGNWGQSRARAAAADARHECRKAAWPRRRFPFIAALTKMRRRRLAGGMCHRHTIWRRGGMCGRLMGRCRLPSP